MHFNACKIWYLKLPDNTLSLLFSHVNHALCQTLNKPNEKKNVYSLIQTLHFKMNQRKRCMLENAKNECNSPRKQIFCCASKLFRPKWLQQPHVWKLWCLLIHKEDKSCFAVSHPSQNKRRILRLGRSKQNKNSRQEEKRNWQSYGQHTRRRVETIMPRYPSWKKEEIARYTERERILSSVEIKKITRLDKLKIYRDKTERQNH